MNKTSADSKEAIMATIRRSLDSCTDVFKNVTDLNSRPSVPTAVVSASGDKLALANQFGANLEKVLGSYEVVANTADIPSRIVSRIVHWSGTKASELRDSPYSELLSWAPEKMPVDNLDERLRAYGISLAVPDDMHDSHTRSEAATKMVGLTGVDVAFAGTGSMLPISGSRKSRSASLLPLHHIALVPFDMIYPNIECWLAQQRRTSNLEQLLREHFNWTLVTGPSKSADIELNLTLGVHGPRDVHVILF